MRPFLTLPKVALKRLKEKRRGARSDAGERGTNQYPSHNCSRPIQLVIGLDFGTSFTKAIVGEARVRYPVPFDGCAIGENALLLPSALCVLTGADRCTLGANGRDCSLYDNLKMPLIQRNFSDQVQLYVVAFLALIFRHTRDWLLNTHSSIYREGLSL